MKIAARIIVKLALAVVIIIVIAVILSHIPA